MNPIDQYNEKGYVILRNFFNNVEIAIIGGHVDQIYNKRANENEAEILMELPRKSGPTGRMDSQACNSVVKSLLISTTITNWIYD